jgi:hypothetical protein
MSNFSDVMDLPASKKIILVEIDIGQDQTDFIGFEPGLWKWQLTTDKVLQEFNFQNGSFNYGSFEGSGTANLGENPLLYAIGSLTVAGVTYTSAASLADMRSTDSSFFYDTTTTILYVHFASRKKPFEFATIRLGISSNFTNHAGVYNSAFYSPKVISVANDNKKKDPLFFGVQNFVSQSIVLDNTDGAFDSFAQQDVFGQEVRMLIGGSPVGGSVIAYADFLRVFTGYVDDFDIDTQIIKISAQDNRKALKRSIPLAVFDSTTYPDINEDNLNRSIPLVYGVVKSMPVVCTNEDETPTPANYNFKVADVTEHSGGIVAITTVYVEGVATATASKDLTNAEFTISNANYTAGEEVTADVSGFTGGPNALLTIQDLLEQYASKPFNSTNYNTSQWVIERLKAEDLGIVIDEPTALIDVINDISKSIYGIFVVESDGKFSFRIYDPDRAVNTSIVKEDLLNNIKVKYDSKEYLTSFVVRYNRRWSKNSWDRTIINADEADLFIKFKNYRSKTFDTLLTTSADATTYAARITTLTNDVVPTFTFTVPLKYVNLELMDTVNVELDRAAKTWFGNTKVLLIGINRNFNNNTITLTGRFIAAASDDPVTGSPIINTVSDLINDISETINAYRS